MAKPVTLYFIFDGVGPLNGEFYTKEELFNQLNYANADDLIGAFCPLEFRRDGATNLRSDLTEDLVEEAYDSGILSHDSKIAQVYIRDSRNSDPDADYADYRRDMDFQPVRGADLRGAA